MACLVADHAGLKTGEPEFMDRNYFRLLASTPTQLSDNWNIGQNHTRSTNQCWSRSPHTTRGSIPSSFGNNIHLNVNAFNEGYYEKFFVEKKKLGRGFRGSVFLCEVSTICLYIYMLQVSLTFGYLSMNWMGCG